MGIFAEYEGSVVERADPEGLGRVKVDAPGIFPSPDFSPWILPYGMFDNTNGRGLFMIPQVGSNIKIVYIQAANDPRFARYIAGPWRAQTGVSEVPSETLNGNPDISVFAFDGFALVVDERDGQQKATLLDRTNGSYFRLDIETGDVRISSVHDLITDVQNDETKTVTNDQTTTVQGKQKDDVTGDSELACANRKVTVNVNEERSITGAWKITVVGNAEITSDADCIVNAKGALRLLTNLQTVLQASAPGGNPLIDGASEVKIGRLANDNVVLKAGFLLWALSHTHSVPGVTVGQGSAVSLPTTQTPAQNTYSTKGKME